MLELITSGIAAGLLSIFSSVPTSTNFTLRAFDFGTGGEDSATSTNFRGNLISGNQSNSSLASVSYILGSGFTPTQNANVTPGPSVTNPSNFYNKLRIALDEGNNPSDTVYLIALSTDGFVTTNYVQNDNSIGPSLSITNYQLFSAWGGVSGFEMLGLSPSTSYEVRVRAMQGNFTESAFSESSSASTVATSLSFGVTTSITSTPPFNAVFSSLPANSVVNSNASINIAISTNANLGSQVFIRSNNSGLVSPLASSTIPSATSNLDIVSGGYGAIINSVNQTSGGPLNASVPFNGVGNSVGGLTTSPQIILSSSNPVFGGTGNIILKAKSQSTTPSSTDYGDTLTYIAAGIF